MPIIKKNLFDFFPDNTPEEVLNGISKLSNKSKKRLIDIFGSDFTDSSVYCNLDNKTKNAIKSIIYCTLDKKINGKNNKRRSEIRKKREKENANTKHKSFSLKKELDYIKKTKLSFYYDVSDDLKKEYLDYYFDVFPKFKEDYEKSDDDKKKELLECAIENSKRYRDKFLYNNQGLVYYVAKSLNIVSDDIIQEGNIGLLTALEKFDVSKGVKFSTYAYPWIKKEIIKYYNTKIALIRTPINLTAKYNKLNNIIEEFYLKNFRYPTDEELSIISNTPINKIKEFREYRLYKYNVDSLDRPIGDTEDSDIISIISSDELSFTDDVDSKIVAEELISIIDKVIVKPEYKYVFLNRLGLIDGRVHGKVEIARHLGIHYMKVEQMENFCIKRIKAYLANLKNSQERQKVNRDDYKLSLEIIKLHYEKGLDINVIAQYMNMNVLEVIKLEKYGIKRLKEEYTNSDGKIKIK